MQATAAFGGLDGKPVAFSVPGGAISLTAKGYVIAPPGVVDGFMSTVAGYRAEVTTDLLAKVIAWGGATGPPGTVVGQQSLPWPGHCQTGELSEGPVWRSRSRLDAVAAIPCGTADTIPTFAAGAADRRQPSMVVAG